MTPLRKELSQSRDFESLEEETYLSLLRTSGILAAPFDRMFQARQLSPPLYNVLRILRGQSGQGLACSHIGERMVTRVPDITRLVDRLVRMGLAERERSREDRRVVRISITDQGLAELELLEAPLVEALEQSLGHMSAREMKELIRLLAKARKTE